MAFSDGNVSVCGSKPTSDTRDTKRTSTKAASKRRPKAQYIRSTEDFMALNNDEIEKAEAAIAKLKGDG